MLTKHIEEEKTRTKHTKTCENSRILTKTPGITNENTPWKNNLIEEQKRAVKNKDGDLVETEKKVKEEYV